MESQKRSNKHYPLTKDGIREALETNVSGVYCVLFASTPGKRYVGSSKNMRARLMAHLNKFTKGQHKNRQMQSSFGRWPNEARFYIIEACSESEARSLEQTIIDFTPKSKLYNTDNYVFNYKNKRRK